MNAEQADHIDRLRTDYAKFRELLDQALPKISADCFALSVAGQEEAIVRERMFCYELYHQLRILFDTTDFKFRIGPEINKAGHPLIRGRYIPDFVVHIPGIMCANLCVLEVKPISGDLPGFAKDIEVLKVFVENYYFAGVHLIFGNMEEGEGYIRTKVYKDLHAVLRAGIVVLWLPRRGEAPVMIT
jgi:hypothetical protein